MPNIIDDFKARFLRIESSEQRQQKFIEQERLDEATRASEAKEARLCSWAASQTCVDEFIPDLEERIRLIEFERVKILSDHPRLCEYLGREAELKALVAQLRTWADKA